MEQTYCTVEEALEELRAKPTADLTSADRLAMADNAAALGDWPSARKALSAAGDTVNLETDIIGKYVEKLLRPQPETPPPGGITWDFLAENGF